MRNQVGLPQAREVCPTSARRLIEEGAMLVDVRERAEIERLAFDVPGVVILPLSEFEQRFAELPRDRELVIACQSGGRSLKATYFLLYKGYTQVSNLEGGIAKWASKGFPTKGAATSSPVAGACCGTQAASSCCSSQDGASVAKGGCCGSAEPASRQCC